MKIKKTTIEVVVYHDDSLFCSPDGFSLEAIADQMSNGDYIGTHRVIKVEDVPAKKVRDELLAIGNDGDFFKKA